MFICFPTYWVVSVKAQVLKGVAKVLLSFSPHYSQFVCCYFFPVKHKRKTFEESSCRSFPYIDSF